MPPPTLDRMPLFPVHHRIVTIVAVVTAQNRFPRRSSTPRDWHSRAAPISRTARLSLSPRRRSPKKESTCMSIFETDMDLVCW